MNILNLDIRTFQITFLHRTSDKQFLFQKGKELVHILETFDHTGIENIKILEQGKFKRVSKKDLLSFFSWDTETMEYLKNHYYFA